jgi:hypothetical protein
MKESSNFIPRHGSPLFYPQDPSEGFQGGSGGLDRRKFLKRTGGATAAAFVSWGALSRDARADNAQPPENISDYLTEYRYRLKCNEAPNPNDGSVSWTEVAGVNEGSQPQNITLSNEGPSVEDTGYVYLDWIIGTFTTSLDPGVYKEKSQSRLGFLDDPFNGLNFDEYVDMMDKISAGNGPPNTYSPYGANWIKSNDEQPQLYYGHGTDNNEVGFDGTPVGATFHMSVNGPISTAEITRSGFKLDNISVTSGGALNSSSTFTNNTTDSYSSESEAAAAISTTGSVEGTVVPVTQKAKLESSVNSNMKTSVSLEKNRDYKNTSTNGAAVNFEATQNYSSVVGGNLTAEWTVVVQRKTRLRANESSANIEWESEWETMTK